MTLGRSFVDIKYIVNEDIDKNSNNINNEKITVNDDKIRVNNLKNNNTNNVNVKNRTNINFNKYGTDFDFGIKNNIVNKNTFIKKDSEIKINKDEEKTNSKEKEKEKKGRRSITTQDLNLYNLKSKTKEMSNNIPKVLPKKKESSNFLRNNLTIKKGNNTNSSINSIREINKMKNKNKPCTIIDNNNNALSQNFKNESKNQNELSKNMNNDDNSNLNNEEKNEIEILFGKELNKSNLDENNEINEEMKKYDTFCIGVFVSGLASPINSTSIIENSEYFVAPCGHSQCSLFPSIQPELLQTYINKNSNSFNNLSHLVANMCFPLGIKPCFGCRFDQNNKIDNLPNPQQVFFNIIKNEKNDIYYIATLQYFIKMSNTDYLMKYKFNPITYYLEKSGNNSNNKDKNFKNNMQMISNSLNNDNIFIPESISLISKYPLFISMDKCLRCMISLQSEDMNNLINHLVNEVPSPKKNYQIQFFIPKIQFPIILNHEYNKFLTNRNKTPDNNNNLLSASQINVKFLLEKISVDNIIMIFQLMLLEQKILFLENNYQTLSEISFIFSELIYPLVWTNPFLPVLSIKTVQFLQSPVPYIMGLDQYLFKFAHESKNIYLGTDMIIFNLMNNQFVSSKTNKRIHKKEIFHDYKLPTIPEKIGDYIFKELKNMKKIIERIEKYKEKKEKSIHEIMSDEELDKKIRMIFLKAMIMLIGDYNNFVFYTEDEVPLFNKEAFVQSHKEKHSQLFLCEMVKTQIFNQFLLNEKQLYIKTKNKIRDISQNNNFISQNTPNIKNPICYELIDTSYFKKLISMNQNLLNSEKIRSRALSFKKPISSKNTKKKLSSQRKSKFIPDKNENINLNGVINSNDFKNSNLKKVNNNLNLGVISPLSNALKENILNGLENNNFEKGNYSIDYIRGGKDKFHANVNLSGCLQVQLKNNDENKLEEINKNDILDKNIQRTKSAKKIFSYIKSNDLSNNSNEIKVEKNILLENVKKILLYPYFLPKLKKNINNLTIKIIEDKIDIYLQKKNFKYQCQDKDHVFIISKKHGFKFENIKQKQIYVIQNNITDKFGMDINKENNEDLTGGKIDNIFNKDESIDNIDLDLIKNNSININKSTNTEIHTSVNSISKNPSETKLIKDCFILCFTNKNRISKEQLKKLDTLFVDEENKLFFANLILPDLKIKKTKNHKQLTPSSFEDLGKILSLSLEHLTSNEFNTCRLLTISSFVYFKIENKKLIYLYENFIHGIYPCRLWLLEDFWKNFFKFEFEDEKKNEKDLLNLYKYNFNGSINYMVDIEKNLIEKNKEQILYETCMFTAEIMIKLKLSKKLIMNIFNDILEQYLEDDKNKIEYLINQITELFDKY